MIHRLAYRTGKGDTLANICQALECQPGDILAWEAD
ncbi:helix-turn-helix domain-containing protein [Raoultella terrigena]|nr:helix-turn-helix domain-containing protein [Raoultella terrigena]